MLLQFDNRKRSDIITYKNPTHSNHDSIMTGFWTPPPTATMATVAGGSGARRKIRKQSDECTQVVNCRVMKEHSPHENSNSLVHHERSNERGDTYRQKGEEAGDVAGRKSATRRKTIGSRSSFLAAATRREIAGRVQLVNEMVAGLWRTMVLQVAGTKMRRKETAVKVFSAAEQARWRMPRGRRSSGKVWPGTRRDRRPTPEMVAGFCWNRDGSDSGRS